MHRRTFMAAGAAVLSGAMLAQATAQQTAAAAEVSTNSAKFSMKFAPHFDMFKESAGADLIDQLKFIADQGFTALEDNGMMGRPVEQQEAIAREMSRLGLTMGVFCADPEFGQSNYEQNDPEMRKAIIAKMKAAVEVGKRVNGKWCCVVPGLYDPKQDWGYQTQNVIDNLKACAEILEPAGMIMTLEPLNHRDHPGMFLTRISQTFQICRAVNSPSVKMQDDLYHQQITEGDLIPNMDSAWSEIAYFQMGDNPGRHEPTTGEINYRNIFKHIKDKGFTGVLGMEHGSSIPGKEGEMAVIAAYRACDPV